MSSAFVTDWNKFIFVVSPKLVGAVSGWNLKAEAFLFCMLFTFESWDDKTILFTCWILNICFESIFVDLKLILNMKTSGNQIQTFALQNFSLKKIAIWKNSFLNYLKL